MTAAKHIVSESHSPKGRHKELTMNGLQLIKTGGVNLLKGGAAAVAAFVGLMVGGLATRALNLPAMSMPDYMNLSTLMPLMFVSEMVMAVALGECFQRLYRGFWPRLLFVWLCHYLLYSALNTLDAFLFTTYTNLGSGFVSNLFPALFAAAAITLLWRPAAGSTVERPSLAAYLSTRRPRDWAWRFAAAWLCFPVIYYLAGRGVAVFTLSYYQDPSHSLGLTLNLTLGSLMAMQVLRGALFLLAVLPIIVAWRGTPRGLWLTVGAVIFVQIAIQTMVQAYWLPFVAVRIPHGVELLVDSFAQAAVYAWLLNKGLGARVLGSQGERELKSMGAWEPVSKG
jgi:hypothetical protein